ncbi:MAG: FmdB family transcriptional regulator [Cryobacterium sp.]|nr:FmdB family transcriptional regulator [Cryobacterium sp.]
MPTYSYRCTECGTAFDIHQEFTDETLTVCPTCGGVLRKVFSPVGISFNGPGFYRTDSRESPKRDSEKTDSKQAASSEASATAKESSTTSGGPAKSKPDSTKSDSAKSDSKKSPAASKSGSPATKGAAS